VGADAVGKVAGAQGATALALVICCAALSALNGTIFTGARLYLAVGNELPLLNRLGLNASKSGNPTIAFAVQAAIAMPLIAFGALTRDGFQAMVAYTAPVFWLFLLLIGISYFILRRREPEQPRPFRAPLYPFTPALFCLTCAYLLYSSLVFAGQGAPWRHHALIGVPWCGSRAAHVHGGTMTRTMSTLVRTAIAMLLAAITAGADAAPNIPSSELPGRERQRFQDSPIDRFTQPGQKAQPLWQWECDPAKTKSRKHSRTNSKRC
jgi:amino acid transporter